MYPYDYSSYNMDYYSDYDSEASAYDSSPQSQQLGVGFWWGGFRPWWGWGFRPWWGWGGPWGWGGGPWGWRRRWWF